MDDEALLESVKFEAKGWEEWPETSSKLVEVESESGSCGVACIVTFL
jgi:hypothetical protein